MKKLNQDFMKRFFLLWGLWLSSGLVLNLMAQNVGKVFTRNYLPQEYHGETQNWAILQDKQGIVYVGNGAGVLRYDGVSWEQTILPNRSSVRSLGISPNGTIYVGASDEFGYLTPNKTGKIVYVSLIDQIPETYRNFKDIWSILVRGNNDVIFQGRTHFFHLKDGKIRAWHQLPNSYHRAFLIDNKVFLRQAGVGICRFTGEDFKVIKDGDFFADKIISSILPHPSGKQLVGTRRSGFFLMDLVNNAGNPIVFESELNTMNPQIYHGIVLQNGNYAYCGLTEGLLITDNQGNLLYQLAEDTDLKSTPYFVYEDQQNAIWVGLSKGIMRAELNKPMTYFGSNSGLRGLVNDLLEVDDKVYVTAGEGVFYIENGEVRQLDNMTRQAWFIERIPIKDTQSTVIFSEDENINELMSDGRIRKIHHFSDGTAGFTAYPSKKHKNVTWIAHTGGLGLLKWDTHPIFEYISSTYEIRHILEDWQGDLWLCTYQNGILKAHFPDKQDFTKVEITKYDQSHGLPSLRYPYVFRADGQVLFGLPEGLYRFDEQQNKFVSSETFGKEFQQRNIFHAVEDRDKNVWISGINNFEAPIGIARYKRRDRYQWYDIPFRRIPQMLENKVFLSKNPKIIWIGGSEGLFRYEMRDEQHDLLHDFHALISEVRLHEDSVLFHGTHTKQLSDSTYQLIAYQDRTQIPKFNYQQNSLTFKYSATSYDYTEGNQYGHYLEPYDKDWVWSKETKKEYTNLPAGKYVFRVKARNIYGKESFEAQYAFTISPPWYRTPLAYFLFIALLFITVWLSIVFYTKRLRKEKEKLEFIVQARTSEVKRKNEVLEEQKTQLAQALGNISTLNEIGQKITSSLELEHLVQTIYQNVNKLGDAPVFGIGSYNPAMQSIEFKGYIENGEKHSYTSESLHNENKFSVWCFNHQKEIVINNLEEDYQNYLNLENYTLQNDSPKSLIYLPLVIDGNPVGVLTLQSYEKNAYINLDITVLRSMASYVAIALENAKSYEVIKENNRKITDSIRYAKTIQNAILPTDTEMTEAFVDYFVIFRPKDIVSGDFFWISHTPERTLLAVVDCTGHGVPGAFMSMVGTDLLTEIVNTQAQPIPYLMLERLDKRIQEALRQDRGFNNDGMDICMVLIEYQKDNTVQLSFTGAKRPLYYYDNSRTELAELRGDKKSVGGIQRKTRNFTNQTIFLEEGDLIYLSSDGMVDQPDINGIKFGTPYLKALLNKYASLSLENQKGHLENSLNSHMGEAPQRDDITVIGIRL